MKNKRPPTTETRISPRGRMEQKTLPYEEEGKRKLFGGVEGVHSELEKHEALARKIIAAEGVIITDEDFAIQEQRLERLQGATIAFQLLEYIEDMREWMTAEPPNWPGVVQIAMDLGAALALMEIANQEWIEARKTKGPRKVDGAAARAREQAGESLQSIADDPPLLPGVEKQKVDVKTVQGAIKHHLEQTTAAGKM